MCGGTMYMYLNIPWSVIFLLWQPPKNFVSDGIHGKLNKIIFKIRQHNIGMSALYA